MPKKKLTPTRNEYRQKADRCAFAVELPRSLVSRLGQYAKRTNSVLRRDVEAILEYWLSLSDSQRQEVRDTVAAKQHSSTAAD